MLLVLLRHGKAEEKQDKNDDDRELTKDGRANMKLAAKGLRRLLTQQEIVIWSSPLVRAVQTAEIIAKGLGKLKVETHQQIADGDLEWLGRELRHLGDELYLIVVGHEPTMSGWGQKISGLALPFKKGAAAAYELDPQQAFPALRAGLVWFTEPKALRILGGEKN